MGLIIGVAGKKQAGKSTVANILHGIVMKNLGKIIDYSIGSGGELLIKTPNAADGKEWVGFDVSRRDEAFAEYAHEEMWPYVKLYSYADELKWIATELFNIPYENIYGTDEQKSKKMRHLRWENMPGVTTEKTPQDPVEKEVAGRLGKYYEKVLSGVVYHKRGWMSGRDFMQFFGTEIMRKIWEPVWWNRTMNKIKKEDSELAIISDVRFPNEADAIKDNNGKLFYLNRNIFDDKHESEVALDKYDKTKYDAIIENNGSFTIEDLKNKVEELYTWK